MLSASFLDFIKKERLFEREEQLLVGISGGLDSVTLAHLLAQNNFQFSLAHMNFQLRGEDSIRDEDFVKDLAKKLGVEVFVKRVDILENSGSTQLQARELRYAWFDTLMKEHAFDRLLTAHHANDLLETAILNLTRGTGIKGLRSILPLQNRLARPLLFASKAELEFFATENSIEWKEDVSNSSNNYTRNKIRNLVVPQLESINPNILSGFQQTTLRLRATEEAWEEKLQRISEQYFQFTEKIVQIDKSILADPHAIVYMSELLASYDFSLVQLQAFEFGRVGAQLFSSSHTLSVDRDVLVLTPNVSHENTSVFPLSVDLTESAIHTPYGNLTLTWIAKENLHFEENANVAFVAFESIDGPLEIDGWHVGDKIQPIGMRGKKKISDILIDRKVPLPHKAQILVLKCGNDIVWVIGHKFSELFKVKKDTTKILRLEYHENS